MYECFAVCSSSINYLARFPFQRDFVSGILRYECPRSSGRCGLRSLVKRESIALARSTAKPFPVLVGHDRADLKQDRSIFEQSIHSRCDLPAQERLQYPKDYG